MTKDERANLNIAIIFFLGLVAIFAFAYAMAFIQLYLIEDEARYEDRDVTSGANNRTHRGGDCYETAYQADARRELLLLIYRADQDRLTHGETVRLRNELRQIELTPCENLLQRISSRMQPASQAPPPPSSTQHPRP